VVLARQADAYLLRRVLRVSGPLVIELGFARSLVAVPDSAKNRSVQAFLLVGDAGLS